MSEDGFDMQEKNLQDVGRQRLPTFSSFLEKVSLGSENSFFFQLSIPTIVQLGRGLKIPSRSRKSYIHSKKSSQTTTFLMILVSDTISVRGCHQNQHEITTPENNTMTSAGIPEKLTSSQNSSPKPSPRTESCSSKTSAILEQRQPLKKTKAKILKPPKSSDNPKLKIIQRQAGAGLCQAQTGLHQLPNSFWLASL